MKLKIGFIVIPMLFLVLVLSNVNFVFAVTWDTSIVNAQSTDLVIDETNGSFSFTVTSPDPGTANSISVVNQASGENHVADLSPGDTVEVKYTGFTADDLVHSPESGYLNYMGPADSVKINALTIPEFPFFLIIPLFMIATFMVIIVYKRIGLVKS